MNSIIDTLIGHGKDLNMLQMSCRAFVLFFVTLLIIRISGMRAFGTKSAFDNIIVIMLGAVLSRAVAGASPFIPTIMAGLVLGVIHRLLGILSMYSNWLNHLIKGNDLSLYKNGHVNNKNMQKACVTGGDLLEEVRLSINQNCLDKVEEIFLERTGEISIVKTANNN